MIGSVTDIRVFLQHVPPLVWVGLLAVLWRAYRYARPRVGRVDRLWLAPAFIGVFSIAALVLSIGRSGQTSLSVLAWLVAAAAGFGIGWITLRGVEIGADHHNGRITIPADWSFPPLLLLFFGIRFYVGWRLAVMPSIAIHLDFALGQIAVSALIAGIFAGKAWALWQKWRGSAREMALSA